MSTAALPRSRSDVVVAARDHLRRCAGSQGFDSSGGALASGELFDPSGGGLWAAVPASTSPTAAYAPQTTVLGSGSGLITGGLADGGAYVNSGLLVSTSGTITLTPITTPT